MKVYELTDALLDYWVARAEGIDATLPKYGPILRADNIGGYYRPSRDWSQGGPIIEREGITLLIYDPKSYLYVPENPWSAINIDCSVSESGATPLEAAMRCYVASKFGDEVSDLNSAEGNPS